MLISAQTRHNAQDLLDYIDASPSPWHAVQTTEQRLLAQGYLRLNENERWQCRSGGRYFVVRGGSSIIAFVLGQHALTESGFRIVGAHTDSPGLRLKPHAAHCCEDVVRLGVEIYGGPILATFTDRDLSLAGRVNVRSANGFSSHLLRFEEALVRLPNLAIHMNREVNDQGLKLHKQNELPLLLGMLDQGSSANRQFLNLVARQLNIAEQDIINAEFNVYDTQRGNFWGATQEFMADSQLDNLASCHAALTALLAVQQPQSTAVCALFDHEEVGSESAAGAGGSFVADVIRRIQAHEKMDEEARQICAANSFFISADMAHAFHPNFPAAYEPQHHVMVNAGVVVKTNASQRYSTGINSAAQFMQWCDSANVPYQQYSHRTDLGCGSTIGPIVAARLGFNSVDVGSPMWAMHSLRESAGVLDHSAMIAALTAAFG